MVIPARLQKNRGTQDALLCVWRAVERALADRGGGFHALALDWDKAFDSIKADALVNSLRRFGLPAHFCSVIQAIYCNRIFEVIEGSEISPRHPQRSGVCQGCPLSSFFFFLIVMTLVMHEVVGTLSPLPVLMPTSSERCPRPCMLTIQCYSAAAPSLCKSMRTLFQDQVPIMV